MRINVFGWTYAEAEAYACPTYAKQEWFHNVRLGIEHSLKHAPKKERQVLPATQVIDPGPRH